MNKKENTEKEKTGESSQSTGNKDEEGSTQTTEETLDNKGNEKPADTEENELEKSEDNEPTNDEESEQPEKKKRAKSNDAIYSLCLNILNVMKALVDKLDSVTPGITPNQQFGTTDKLESAALSVDQIVPEKKKASDSEDKDELPAIDVDSAGQKQ